MPARRDRDSRMESIRHMGRDHSIIGRRRIAGRTYLLLKQLAAPPRTRFQAFDPRLREFRGLISVPAEAVGRRHLRAIQRSSSANDSIPKLIDFVRIGDEFWLVLTWVAGSDLKQYLRRVRSGQTPRPSSREVIRLLRGLAHGLRHLHNDCNLVHGDLSPSNLVLQSRPTRLVTIDFGNAWLREAAMYAETGDGTSAIYAAPELQDGDSQPDFRSDQFSASVIAYELLTLQIPYGNLGGQAGRPGLLGDSPVSLNDVSANSSDAKQLPKSIRQGIDDVIARGLSLSANDRFETPRAWVDALDQLWHDLSDRGDGVGNCDPLWRIADWATRLVRRKDSD